MWPLASTALLSSTAALLSATAALPHAPAVMPMAALRHAPAVMQLLPNGMPPVDPQKASLQFMITNAMRAELQSLGYQPSEIDSLDPPSAATIISQATRSSRPAAPGPERVEWAGPTYQSGRASRSHRRT